MKLFDGRKSKVSLAIILGVAGLLIFATATAYVWEAVKTSDTELATWEDKTEDQEETKPLELTPANVRMKLMFFGDLILARGVDLWAQASPLKYAYPFSKLNTFERGKYDAWIGDLDCPVTTKALSFDYQKTNLIFNCPPGYIKEMGKWFDAVSLATNHTYDQQEVDGFAQTRNYLKQNGIQYFGNHENSYTKDICEVITLRARVVDEQGKLMKDGKQQLPIVLCGYHNVFRQATAAELAVISKFAPHLPTIVMPHMGVEYQPKADSIKTAQYRTMIDNGADAVIGNHPHWVQNTEVYKGKLIAYSLGNFIFDQNFESDVMRSIGISLDITFTYDDNLAKWIELAPECAQFQDQCLAKAKAQNLKKPKFSIHYDMVAVDGTNKLTKKGDKTLHNILMERTNWAKTAKTLNQ